MQGDLDSIEKMLYTMDILVKHFQSARNDENPPSIHGYGLSALGSMDIHG